MLTFGDIRKGSNPKPIVIKSYDLNGSKVIITNEQSRYIATIDKIVIDNDGFDNPLDAENAVEEVINKILES